MRAWCDRDLTRGPGLGLDRCRAFLVADRCRRQDREHARLPRGSLGRGHGLRSQSVYASRFRREERLGRLASACGPFGMAEGELDAEIVAIAKAFIAQRTVSFDPTTYPDRYQE